MAGLCKVRHLQNFFMIEGQILKNKLAITLDMKTNQNHVAFPSNSHRKNVNLNLLSCLKPKVVTHMLQPPWFLPHRFLQHVLH